MVASLSIDEREQLSKLLHLVMGGVAESHKASCTNVTDDALPCVLDIQAAFFDNLAELVRS